MRERVKIEFSNMNEGLHWVFTNSKGDKLSIICHNFSHGWENGLFETQCSWLKDVQGNLDFGQVQRKINTLKRREEKNERTNESSS